MEYLLSGPNPSPKQPLEISQPAEVGLKRVEDAHEGASYPNGCDPVGNNGSSARGAFDTGAQFNMIQVGTLSPEMF